MGYQRKEISSMIDAPKASLKFSSLDINKDEDEQVGHAEES